MFHWPSASLLLALSSPPSTVRKQRFVFVVCLFVCLFPKCVLSTQASGITKSIRHEVVKDAGPVPSPGNKTNKQAL